MPALEDKSSAILCLLLVLQKHTSPSHPLSNGQLIEKLQQEYGISITPNTLRKHLDRLVEIGYPISRHCDNKKGVYLEQMDSEYVDEEVRVLVDGVLTSRFITAKHAEDLIRKLTKFGSKDFPKQLGHIQPIDAWNHRDDPSFFLHLGDLTEAVSEGKFVEFYYCDVSTDKKLVHKRKKKDCVIPLAVVCTHGQYYLIARYPRAAADKVFHFRIDRMAEVMKLETTVPKQEQRAFDLAKYTAEHHFMYGGKINLVVLKMPTTLAGDVLDQFGNQAKMFDQGDGTMEVHLFATEEGMRFFALQYGASGCEVIRPQSLREQVKRDIIALTQQYQITQ